MNKSTKRAGHGRVLTREHRKKEIGKDKIK
jgi:hypothetical protein